MKYLDGTDKVKQWASEENAFGIMIPSQRRRRYFPDFIISFERADGCIVQEVVEIKPHVRQYHHLLTPSVGHKHGRNSGKPMPLTLQVESCSSMGRDRGMSFRLLTEKDVPGWTTPY